MSEHKRGREPFVAKKVIEGQTDEAVEKVLETMYALVAEKDQATIQAGCAALAQMIRIEHKAVTD